ncbi:MAG: hypothetical protein JOZ46_11815 [Candidatus Dormibacteraeota bacterium]|nr:hypothetical protein [Candidatus Dormibacteraeota bacterium]MBV9526486.1 hypothetical protein [Candidatus Dormibacteraeota bacterium]
MPLREPRAAPATTTATGATFARRHPILTAFGVLAGLSLFAAYFPVSAIVTAVVVGVHATGADKLGLRAARRVGAAVLQRWHARHAPPPGGAQPPSPDGPQARSAATPGARGRTTRPRTAPPLVRGVTHPRATRRVAEPRVPAGSGRDLEL